MVAIALIVGSVWVRIKPQINVGSVLPPAIVKKVMIKSSSDSAMAMKAAPITVGRMIGNVTEKKALSGDAPRSRAPSTTVWSKPSMRA